MYKRIYGENTTKGGISANSPESTGEDMLNLAKALVLFKGKAKKRYGAKPKKESPAEREERMKKGKNTEPSPKKLKQKKKEKKNNPQKDLTDTDEERVAKPTANGDATEEELKNDLHVENTNFKIMQNALMHYTHKYRCVTRKEDKDLVLRRGFTFDMEIKFDRPFDFNEHYIAIMMGTGRCPDVESGTFAMIEVTGNEAPEKRDAMTWWVNVKKQEGQCLELEIHIPANCIIGHWQMTISTTNATDKTSDNDMLMFEDPMDIIILFNPWCKDDDVYFPTTKLLDEYVLNQDGIQYTGSAKDWSGKPWRYGQFANGILDICIYIIMMAFRGQVNKKMSDPVKVSRKISKIINNCDDNGVLIGNWSGNYDDGKKPTSWTGSVKILQEYEKKNFCEPVKYGQCWVFSGVTTTVCRALGIPAKSITNYSSAHDTDGSLHIDRFWKKDEDSYKFCGSTKDSTWNFHVWNEVWMARRDLPDGYDGWQAVDSTPQELSDDVFCCGPTPLAAIKKGDGKVKYDTRFLFSEVNADIIDWEIADSGERIKLATDKHAVGVSTMYEYKNTRW